MTDFISAISPYFSIFFEISIEQKIYSPSYKNVIFDVLERDISYFLKGFRTISEQFNLIQEKGFRLYIFMYKRGFKFNKDTRNFNY